MINFGQHEDWPTFELFPFGTMRQKSVTISFIPLFSVTVCQLKFIYLNAINSSLFKNDYTQTLQPGFRAIQAYNMSCLAFHKWFLSSGSFAHLKSEPLFKLHRSAEMRIKSIKSFYSPICGKMKQTIVKVCINFGWI